jgi:hypothetical protein
MPTSEMCVSTLALLIPMRCRSADEPGAPAARLHRNVYVGCLCQADDTGRVEFGVVERRDGEYAIAPGWQAMVATAFATWNEMVR